MKLSRGSSAASPVPRRSFLHISSVLCPALGEKRCKKMHIFTTMFIIAPVRRKVYRHLHFLLPAKRRFFAAYSPFFSLRPAKAKRRGKLPRLEEALRSGINTCPCRRPCRVRREPRARAPSCRPPQIRWSGPWKRWRLRSAGRYGSPWWDPRYRT